MYRKYSNRTIRVLPLVAFIALSAFTPKGQVYEGGKELYEKKCAKCHGKDGAKGLFGARNLQISRLDDADYVKVITSGRNRMPAWEKKLTEGQINLIVLYVKELRRQNH